MKHHQFGNRLVRSGTVLLLVPLIVLVGVLLPQLRILGHNPIADYTLAILAWGYVIGAPILGIFGVLLTEKGSSSRKLAFFQLATWLAIHLVLLFFATLR